MNQLLDAIGIALSSIWTNKLRSFMMVLGNIVAVTSIIAVVSLIQGMNGYVADAITRNIGIGTFRIEKVGIVANGEEQRKAQRRPDINVSEVRAIRNFGGQIDAVMPESGAGSNVTWHNNTLENTRIRGVSSEYDRFSDYNAVLGRLPGRLEVDRSRPVVYLGWDTADKLFQGRPPLD